jgi:WhiB family transcriptional regulator, redox-sensing transcriptional regulator
LLTILINGPKHRLSVARSSQPGLIVFTPGGRLLEAGKTTESKGPGQMIADTSWMAVGLCREHSPKVFFPTDGVGVEKARKICATCPVKEPCLEYAVDNRIEHGVWGGMSERGRRRLARSRKLVSATAGGGRVGQARSSLALGRTA